MYINTYNAYYENGDGWWIPIRNKGTVLHINENVCSECIGILKGGEKTFSSDIVKTYVFNGKVFFFSRVSYELWIYEKATKEINYLKYNDEDVEMISNVEIVNGKAWIFPNKFSNHIVTICLDNETKVEIINWGVDTNLGECSITRTSLYGTCIYFLNRSRNNIYIFELNTENGRMQKKQVIDAEYVNCLKALDDRIYILYRSKKGDSCLGIINKDLEMINCKVLSEIRLSDSLSIDFFKLEVSENNLLAISSMRGEIVKINPESGEIKKYLCESIDPKYAQPGAPLLNDIQLNDNKIYIFSPVLGEIYMFNNDLFHNSNIQASEESINAMLLEEMKEKGIIFENEDNSLNRLISAISM